MADPKAALVLSGGSIQGAYQAGAIEEIFKSKFLPTDQGNFKPSAIYGVSTGAMNGAFLAERAGATGETDPLNVDWPDLGTKIRQFWIDNITSFSDLGKERNIFVLLFQIAFNRFNGLTTMNQLDSLIDDTFDINNFAASPVEFKAGVVDLIGGNYLDADFPGTGDDFIKYILASTKEPINMPLMEIADKLYMDGGTRDITPLGSAINSNAERIAVVITEPVNINVTDPGLNFGKILTFVERVTGIIRNEITMNDIKTAERINHICLEFGDPLNNHLITGGHFDAKRYIPIITVRPAVWSDVKVIDFDTSDIIDMINQGKTDAAAAIVAGPIPPAP